MQLMKKRDLNDYLIEEIFKHIGDNSQNIIDVNEKEYLNDEEVTLLIMEYLDVQNQCIPGGHKYICHKGRLLTDVDSISDFADLLINPRKE